MKRYTNKTPRFNRTKTNNKNETTTTVKNLAPINLSHERKRKERFHLNSKHSWICACIEYEHHLLNAPIQNLTQTEVEFDVTFKKGLEELFSVGETVDLRLYLGNDHNFIPVRMRVAHFRPYPVPGNLTLFRLCGRVDKTDEHYQSYSKLIDFLQTSNVFIEVQPTKHKRAA